MVGGVPAAAALRFGRRIVNAAKKRRDHASMVPAPQIQR